ncbi:acylneuraminate cytidylyltransferase family protein [Tepidibacter formicigenes]|uniref:CMP-N,N'-diacetyllegionaminic acid synthase n=1 Tax=Tepidibacter formicigenes DSM 15518 TaxID=1123349 RepID=A0A1M6NZR6_9FIRM|nr:acylneuraminate cytidylyltransferase family protein [Tepidibacter formicigenes]SHK01229.1 CMP-N,N'-diacetyllegionaminic acid synthase [Tepidibacter formicigenes DSM 15518]
MEILAIIPARGGSKGVPRKNIKNFNGKPLIAWTIEAAKKSKYVSKVLVNTEDKEIAQISKEYGADIPFLRPENLAQDDTPTMDVIIHTIKKLKENSNYNPDYILLLQCTSPLRNENHIDEAVELIINKKVDSIISVTEVEHTPFWMKKIDNNGHLQDFIAYDKKKLTRRQDFPKLYRLNGAIYIAKTDKLLEFKDFETNRTIPYVMDRVSSIDIDSLEDFNIAQFYMKNLKG